MQKTVRTSQPKVSRSEFSQSAQVLPKLKGYVSLRSLASHPPIRNTQYAIPKEAGSRWECTLVSSKTPAQPHIPAERTAHWGIFSQSKAKDFRMCYFGFIATKKKPHACGDHTQGEEK